MVIWRVGRGWGEADLRAHLDGLRGRARNFSEPEDGMTVESGWHRYYSEAVIARVRAGAPEKGGAFERGCTAVAQYAFSDPRIVIAHFDADAPLSGRYLLLEIRALRVLHYLGGVVVTEVRSGQDRDRSVFGFRYDTLEGHIEQGSEWFLLTQEHATGTLRFRIEATWRPGQFPNWWSRLGFSLLGRHYQEVWHRRAHHILAGLVHDPTAPLPEPGPDRLVHTNLDVTFKRFEAHHV